AVTQVKLIVMGGNVQIDFTIGQMTKTVIDTVGHQVGQHLGNSARIAVHANGNVTGKMAFELMGFEQWLQTLNHEFKAGVEIKLFLLSRGLNSPAQFKILHQ